METEFTSEEVKAAIKKLQKKKKKWRLQQTPTKMLEETMLKQNRQNAEQKTSQKKLQQLMTKLQELECIQ